MTKADIVERLYNKGNFTKTECIDYIETAFELIKSSIESEGKLKIAGFGNFEVKQKNDRRGRNPQTGETITITSRKILTFKPSNVLKSQLNPGK